MIPRNYGGETAREYEAATAAAMSGGGWAGMPVAARAMADRGWEYAYWPAYWTTYTSVASGTLLAARTAVDKLDESTDPAGQLRTALDALGGVAAKLRERVQPHGGSPVGGSVDAEVAAGPRSSDREVARLRGAVDGTLEGAREIVTGWRASTPASGPDGRAG